MTARLGDAFANAMTKLLLFPNEPRKNVQTSTK
jgi:hypothetical protein